MDNQPWLDRVREQLARQALPPSYIKRFMEELTDHFNDLMEENMEGDVVSQLGQPEQVAGAAAVAYRQHRFLGRHCWARVLVFGVCNILLIVVLMFLLKGTPLGRTPIIGHAIGWLLMLVASPIKVYKLVSGHDAFSIPEFVVLLSSNGLLYGLIVETVVNFRKRSSMAAFFVFGVSPVMSLVVLCSLSAALVLSVLASIGIKDGSHFDTLSTDAVIFAMSLLTVIIPSVIATILYSRLAERAGVSRKWIVVACVTVAVIASSAAYWRAGPVDRPWHFGVAWSGLWSAPRDWVPWLQFLLHVSAPLAIGWWFMRRTHDQSRLQLAA